MGKKRLKWVRIAVDHLEPVKLHLIAFVVLFQDSNPLHHGVVGAKEIRVW
jgi:hypothetical protein